MGLAHTPTSKFSSVVPPIDHVHPELSTDIRDIVQRINRRHRTAYEIVGTLAGGTVGAYQLAAPGGAQYVLKWLPGAVSTQYRLSALAVAELRRHGYPTPAFRHVGEVLDQTYVITDFVRGERMAPLSRRNLPVLLELVESQRGAANHRSFDWSSHVEECVFRDSAGWAAQLRANSAPLSRLVDRAMRLVQPFEANRLAREDAVHGDFGPHNILVDEEGNVAAVIDCDAAGHGTRAFDLGWLIEDDETGEVRNDLAERMIAIGGMETYAIHAVYRTLRTLARQRRRENRDATSALAVATFRLEEVARRVRAARHQ